jgi:hypothetical protein
MLRIIILFSNKKTSLLYYCADKRSVSIIIYRLIVRKNTTLMECITRNEFDIHHIN